jgi:hypothetical protein
VFKTIDAGSSWTNDNFGSNVNRFRFFGDSLGYAAGEYVYKYQNSTIGISEVTGFENPISISPNPFTRETAIDFEVLEPGLVSIKIIDISGRRVLNVSQKFDVGNQVYYWDGRSMNGNLVSAGIFKVRIESTKLMGFQKVIKLKSHD